MHNIAYPYSPCAEFFEEVNIIVDGIDECKQSESSVIWQELDSILKRVPAKVLIGSEDQTDLHLKGFKRIRVDQRHNKADIDTYIDQQIGKLSGHRQLLSEEKLRKDIKTRLQTKADGMFVCLFIALHVYTFTNKNRFVWIHLVLQIISDECTSEEEVAKAVEEFPAGLEALYSRCLKRKRKDQLLCNVDLLI